MYYHSSRRNIFVGVIRQIMLLSIIGSIFTSSLVMAVVTLYRFNIPGQPASTALTEFARQAELQVLFPFDRVMGIRTKSLVGKHSPQKAIKILLKGTGLKPVFNPSGALSIKVINKTAQEESPVKLNNKNLKGIAAFLATTVTSGVNAQVLEEIVVTAQKRVENQQDVPIAITTITADRLEAAGISSTLDLAEVTPGLVMPINVGRVIPRIRGVGTTANGPGFENSVAMYIDDVYIASSNASIFSLSNVQRVEVLRGPQGTLFGRNATGGVVHVITKNPEQEFGGNVSLGYGNYDTFNTSGYLTGGISDKVSADFAFYYQAQGDGYGTNFFDDSDVYKTPKDLSLRSKWQFDISDTTLIRVGVDYNDVETSSGLAIRLADGALNSFGPASIQGDHWDVNQDFSPKLESDSWGLNVRVEHDFGPVSLTSITAVRNADYYRRMEFDGLPITALTSTFDWESDQFSQEFQLSSNSDGSLKWLAGLFFFDVDDDSVVQTDIAGPAIRAPRTPGGPTQVSSITRSELNAKSIAGFGEISYDFSDKTRLTLGARYTKEDRTLSDASNTAVFNNGTSAIRFGPLGNETEFDKFTWRIALDHHFSDSMMGYASVNTGFKSGGYNSARPTDPAFRPEELTAYEIGLKSDLLDQRLRINVALFYYDYKDIQVRRRDDGLITIFNGPGSEIYGLDVDFEAILTERLRLTGGLELLDHSFTDFPNAAGADPRTCPTAATVVDGFISCPSGTGRLIGGTSAITVDAEGNGLPYTSDTMFNLTADYQLPVRSGDIHFSTTYTYNDGYFFEPDNFSKQDSFSTVSASILWTDSLDRYSVRLWGRNLTDEDIIQNYAAQSFIENAFYAPPRTFGVSVKYRF